MASRKRECFEPEFLPRPTKCGVVSLPMMEWLGLGPAVSHRLRKTYVGERNRGGMPHQRPFSDKLSRKAPPPLAYQPLRSRASAPAHGVDDAPRQQARGSPGVLHGYRELVKPGQPAGRGPAPGAPPPAAPARPRRSRRARPREGQVSLGAVALNLSLDPSGNWGRRCLLRARAARGGFADGQALGLGPRNAAASAADARRRRLRSSSRARPCSLSSPRDPRRPSPPPERDPPP